MDVAEIRRRLDEERRTLARDGEVIEVLPDVTRLRAADGSHHNVIYSALTGDTADAVIEREVEHHRRLGVAFEWKLYAHDRPADLLDRLRGRGFDVGPVEAVMACEVGDASAWPGDPPGCAVVRVERLEQVDVYRRVAEATYGKDYGFTAGQLAAGIRAGSTQHVGYIAYAGDEPASIARLYTHPQSRFAGLYGGGTRKEFRGRGLYRALVAARARDAARLGARYLIIDALPTSRPIVERMGFRHVTDTWPCEWRP